MTDAFAASVDRTRRAASGGARPALDDGPGSPVRVVEGDLTVWERVVRQLESGWAPWGGYPADLYRERLESRDALAAIGARLPAVAAEPLDRALRALDGRFAAATRAIGG
ncbi:hypothetical protein ABZ934_16375 [Streptomyces sp. NPDC046557]|uniref:hypothetical protein n=1 Tax=Streptomyces sp. NPDC046557 TaxID=3155372 RepID=UPI0033C16C49